MSDSQRLTHLFDLAYDSKCTLVVWDLDEPGASAALEAWASARGITATRSDVRDVGGASAVIDVKPWSSTSRITVYAR
jgi:hypothetical protein